MFKLQTSLLCFTLLMFAACSSTPQKEDPAAQTKAQAIQVEDLDGHERLNPDVIPQRYTLDLSIDPTKDRFSGSTTIAIKITSATKRLTLHAEEMTFSSAKVMKGDQEVDGVKLLVGKNGGIGLAKEDGFEPGDYSIKFVFDAALDEVPTGLYRVNEKGKWYAFTQFEPLEAREAFPSFDEPRFKTPYDVTLRVPKNMMGVANNPQTSMKEEGDQAVYTFSQTKDLPSYLVAFAVGEFDVVDGGSESMGIPFRILVPKGKSALAKYALESTPAIMKSLTQYFGQAYPFEKLDFVAVPNFSAGAMENVGLVTYRETILLIDENNATPSAKRRIQNIVAHELAHMWFGNLVTPEWWDDLWLNEAFATWMASKVVAEVAPEFETEISTARRIGWLMNQDSLAQTRAIRQPIANGGDVYNAFDGITYTKGAQVLGMTEAWLGESVFQKGVQQFMKDNAYKAVTTPSLMKALEKASGKPVYAMMKTFIEQPGVPLLSLTAADKPLTYNVSQKRYLPYGSQAALQGAWFIPACVKYKIKSVKEIKTHCFEITQPEQIIALPEAKKGAKLEWIHPNAQGSGYYIWSLPTDDMKALTVDHRSALSTKESVGVAMRVQALLDSRTIAPKLYYDIMLAMAKEQNPHLLSLAYSAVRSMRGVALEVLKMPKAYASLIQKTFTPHRERLGMEPVAGESPVQANMRLSVLGMLGKDGQSTYVNSNAKSLTPAFFEAPQKFSNYRAQWAIPLIAESADALLWEKFAALATDAPTPSVRITALRALGSVKDPALVQRSLDLFFDPNIRSNEYWYLVSSSMGDMNLFQTVTWPWFQKNYAAIVEKLGDKAAPQLASMGYGFCSEAGAKEVEAFFGALKDPVTGLERRLSNVLEQVRQCESRRAYLKNDVEKVLGAAKKK